MPLLLLRVTHVCNDCVWCAAHASRRTRAHIPCVPSTSLCGLHANASRHDKRTARTERYTHAVSMWKFRERYLVQQTEVLVLTHERASVEEIMPYHVVRLNPMPVVEMVGRSRALEPPCARDASVFSWWRDRVTIRDPCQQRTIALSHIPETCPAAMHSCHIPCSVPDASYVL
jgi:hypothetical protein